MLTRGPVWVMAPTVAATASGAAVVAWLETGSARRRTAVMAATRPSADAPFGTPQRLGSSAISYTSVRAGIDDDSGAHVAWFENSVRSGALHVASAAPGARFAPARELGEGTGFLADGALALAVAADGRALVAGPLGDRLGLWELAPLGDRFRRIARLEAASDQIALALQPGGAAVLAARHDGREPIVLVRRPAGGSFGEPEALLPPADVAPPRRTEGSRVTFTTEGELDSRLSAALSPSEEIVVTTHAAASSEGPARIAAWRGTLAGAGSGRVVGDGKERIRIAGRARSLGSACRAARPSSRCSWPTAASRSPGATTADRATSSASSSPSGAGRVHVAIPSDAAPVPVTPPVAPRLRARLLGDGVVGSGTPLRLRVSCGDVPCDVRAEAAIVPFSAAARGVDRIAPIVVASTPIAAGRHGELRLDPADQAAFARPGETGSAGDLADGLHPGRRVGDADDAAAVAARPRALAAAADRRSARRPSRHRGRRPLAALASGAARQQPRRGGLARRLPGRRSASQTAARRRGLPRRAADRAPQPRVRERPDQGRRLAGDAPDA